MLTLVQLVSLTIVQILSFMSWSCYSSPTTQACQSARHLQPFVKISLVSEDATFCPVSSTTNSNSRHCCSSDNWISLFPNSWGKIAGTFNSKIFTLDEGLKQGIDSVKAMKCPVSELQSSTLSVLNELTQTSWLRILNSTMSPECRLKVVQATTCPGICEPDMPSRPPCRSFCLNILRGCVGDLTKLIVPWKFAMNSVRSAIRLLKTPMGNGNECENPTAADTLSNLLSSWREPLQWLDNGCEELQNSNCYNGRDVGSYTKPTPNLGSNANPEFPFSRVPAERSLQVDVSEFKGMLESVSQKLEQHWPKATDDSSNSEGESLALTLSDELGSGHGGGGGGGAFNFNLMTTDDEDLGESGEYGSGSGGGGDTNLDFSPSTGLDESTDMVLPPDTLPPHSPTTEKETQDNSKNNNQLPTTTNGSRAPSSNTKSTSTSTPTSSSSKMSLNFLILLIGASLFFHSHHNYK